MFRSHHPDEKRQNYRCVPETASYLDNYYKIFPYKRKLIFNTLYILKVHLTVGEKHLIGEGKVHLMEQLSGNTDNNYSVMKHTEMSS